MLSYVLDCACDWRAYDWMSVDNSVIIKCPQQWIWWGSANIMSGSDLSCDFMIISIHSLERPTSTINYSAFLFLSLCRCFWLLSWSIASLSSLSLSSWSLSWSSSRSSSIYKLFDLSISTKYIFLIFFFFLQRYSFLYWKLFTSNITICLWINFA